MAFPLSPQELKKFQALETDGDRVDRAAVIIIDHLLGADWRPRNVFKKAGDRGFFRFNMAETNVQDVRVRLLRLAENLHNLSGVRIAGWPEFLRLCRRDMTDGRFTELNTAAHFYCLGIPFAFHTADKYTYDFDVTIRSGLVVPTEVKGRATGDFDAEKMIGKLSKGAAQLPKEQPGAMFFEHPGTWVRNEWAPFKYAIDKFLRRNTRIVSLTAYTNKITVMPADYRRVQPGHIEIISRFHKFERDVDWSIFGAIGTSMIAVAKTPWETIHSIVKWYMDGQPIMRDANRQTNR